MKSICVFCGSSLGDDPRFAEAARSLGAILARDGIRVIYGGANVGLMGVLADATLEAGGEVIGVLPRFLRPMEMAHAHLTELILCDSMFERKQRMIELSEGFIALPGGFGTLDEVSEVLTLQQVGQHGWPIGFLNLDGYYDHLDRQFARMEGAGLLRTDVRRMAIFAGDLEELLDRMKRYRAPQVSKWL